MKTKLPEVLQVSGVLYSYTDYPVGSVERAKALFADMWDKSRLTEGVISDWDEAKARILKEKAWEKLGYPDPETVLREIFGERYDLVELGKVHLSQDKTIGEAEAVGRSEMARRLKAENPGLSTREIAREVGCAQSTVVEALQVIGKGFIETTPDHIQDKRGQADFRKLSIAGQDRVRAGEPLNRVATEEGIRRRLSPLEQAQKSFRRLSKEDRDAFDLWRAEQPL